MKNNYVAKHSRRFNMAAVHTNRKRAISAGYCKHKSLDFEACELDLDSSDTITPDAEENSSQRLTDDQIRRKDLFSSVCPIDEGVLIGYTERCVNETYE